jgi:UDP-2,3-diacylglucosamine hydrolase
VTRLGLIAGNGVFPIEVATAARRRGIGVIAIAHLNETERALEPLCDRIEWVRVGELQRIIDVLKTAEVDEAAMAGGISRARLKDAFAPDARALAMLQRVGRFSDDAVLRGVAAEIESEGIRVIDPVPLIPDALAGAGLQAGSQPSDAQLRDLALAFSVTRAVGQFDVGQTVAVLNGVVAAVEAVEGTDAALRRAAALCGPGLVVAKAAKPGQDMRFDRPAIGPGTIELLSEIGAAMIGVEAGRALILERERTIRLARERRVSIYGCE